MDDNQFRGLVNSLHSGDLLFSGKPQRPLSYEDLNNAFHAIATKPERPNIRHWRCNKCGTHGFCGYDADLAPFACPNCGDKTPK